MNDYPLLTSIVYEREFVHQWPFVQVDNDNRLYYKVGESASDTNFLRQVYPGFIFYSVEWAGCSGDHDKDFWNLESVEVECGIHGIAYWDGIRHLYWGHDDTKNYGYHYYPDLKQEISVLSVLRTLEEKYCEPS